MSGPVSRFGGVTFKILSSTIFVSAIAAAAFLFPVVAPGLSPGPEPGTMFLFGTGIIALFLVCKTRR